jgi:hypothetical protein
MAILISKSYGTRYTRCGQLKARQRLAGRIQIAPERCPRIPFGHRACQWRDVNVKLFRSVLREFVEDCVRSVSDCKRGWGWTREATPGGDYGGTGPRRLGGQILIAPEGGPGSFSEMH